MKSKRVAKKHANARSTTKAGAKKYGAGKTHSKVGSAKVLSSKRYGTKLSGQPASLYGVYISSGRPKKYRVHIAKKATAHQLRQRLKVSASQRSEIERIVERLESKRRIRPIS